MSLGALLLIVAIVSAGGGVAEPPPAATAATHALVIGGEAGELSSGELASAGSVDWRWTTPRGETLALGVATHSVAGSGWTVGRLVGVTRVGERLVFDGDVAAGSGRREREAGAAPFTYLSARAGATFAVAPGRLWVSVADRYLDVAPLRGHLPEAGLTAQLRPSATVALRYGHSVGGNLGTDYGAARLDLTVRGFGVIAGLALGRSAPEVFDLVVADRGGDGDLRQLFAGVRLPLARCSLTLVADRLEVAAATRETLTLVLEVPLGGRGRGR